MKKILIITMSILLAACGVVQPVQQEQPTPVIEVQTVVVTVIAPTEIVPPTAVPTDVPTEVPTVVPIDTPTLVPTADTSASSSGSDLTPVLVDNVLGKGVFADIKFSSDRITLNCYPREFEITMRAVHPDITRAEIFYRVVEAPGLFRYSDWYLLGNMNTDGKGNFFITFKATDINPDWRGLNQTMIEFQFAGVNKGGGVVDRTQKIEKLVTYYKNCP
ncbi:MAG: hypothetical protein KF758_17890 [Anaerolineales bacterium]|nr:hypothetical protein [Anaerolineales bacterium]MBX3038787.1 hypothetical protein [Anaerolineales bacterium]